MSPARLAAAALAGVALAVLLLWSRTPPPAVPPAPESRPVQPAPAPAAVASAPPLAARTAPPERALLRAALRARLGGAALSRERLDRLAAGEVAAVAAALAADRTPGAPALLAELAELCRELREAPAEGDAADARAVLGAAVREEATSRALEALIEARRAGARRLAGACGAARFDAGAIERELAASARMGDAASLERLALAGAGDRGKLASAALLGAPHAQLRLGLDQLRDQPGEARSWLEAAARRDAEAEAYYGTCLLAGCAQAPDPAAARTALESAARRGAPFALGLLASGGAPEAPQRWSPAGAIVSPVPPPDLEALGVDAAERYAWATLAGTLAARGCFGFDLALAAEALAARPRLERSLSPADVAAGERAAAELEAAAGGEIRGARGCE